MFAGHVGVALAVARLEPRVNLGLFTAASLLLDLLLWSFVLLGWESVAIPADFAQTHQPAFAFPYSHGLLASVLWSASAAAFVGWPTRSGGVRWRPAFLVAGVVFSHWLLDALVHRPELPLSGSASPQVGLGLWNHMPLALGVEAILVLLGLWLFLPGCGLSRPRKLALACLSLLLLSFTVVGMTVAPAPPSAAAMAASSLTAIVLVCGVIAWLASGHPARRA